MRNCLDFIWYGQKNSLPVGYREVQYLESMGEQWIDTMFVPETSWTFGFDVKYLVKTQIPNAGCVFGGRTSSGVNDFQLTTYSTSASGSGTLRLGHSGADGGFGNIGILSNVTQSVSYSHKRYIDPSGVETYKASLNETAGVYSIYVFGLNQSGASVQNGSGCRIYYLKLSDNNVLARNYVPCVRISDSKPGLYDLCGSICPLTGTPFYVNSGTGIDFMWKEFDGPDTNEIWYYAPSQVTLYNSTGVTEHTFTGGKGVVKFNAPVTSLYRTFMNTDITRVLLPSGIVTLGTQTFSGCSNLIDVKMPESIQLLSERVFAECTSLDLHKLPSSLTGIGNFAFENCSSLTSLMSLPSGIVDIGGYAFIGCASLRLTALPDGITIINNRAFSRCAIMPLAKLPESVQTIMWQSFFGCNGITRLTLPANVKTLDSECFYACVNLEDVTFLGRPDSIANKSFGSCLRLTTIRVPWSDGDVANAPWGATNATIIYDYVQ